MLGLRLRSAHVLILRLRSWMLQPAGDDAGGGGGGGGFGSWQLHPRATLRSLKLWIWRGSFGLFVFGVPATQLQTLNSIIFFVLFEKSKTPSERPSFTLCKYAQRNRVVTLLPSCTVFWNPDCTFSIVFKKGEGLFAHCAAGAGDRTPGRCSAA